MKNLEKEVTQQQLYSLFETCGEIQSCKLEIYPDGASRGFAYVQYAKEEEADQAIEKLNGHELLGKKIEVSRHEKKENRANLN